jgi:hypothetical protein
MIPIGIVISRILPLRGLEAPSVTPSSISSKDRKIEETTRFQVFPTMNYGVVYAVASRIKESLVIADQLNDVFMSGQIYSDEILL